jgi:molecular chaperone DnaK (HSP70)
METILETNNDNIGNDIGNDIVNDIGNDIVNDIGNDIGNDITNFIQTNIQTGNLQTLDDDEEIIVGIDLGTTTSCVCYWKEGNCIVIPDEKGNKTIPSYVGYTNKSRYIGADAKNQSLLNSNVYYEVKRLIGRKFVDQDVQKEKDLLSYEICEDKNTGNILLKSSLDKVFTPEEISAAILSKLKLQASEFLKRKISKAIITIPARFTDSQRQATLDAAKIAGLECVRTIHEPTAAAMAYGLTNRKLKPNEILNIIVYDLGGGTLDVSIVEISTNSHGDNIFTVIGSAGNTHLGGADFDAKLVSFSLRRFKMINKIDKFDDLPAISLQKLKQTCENAKKILSTKNKTYIAVKEFYNGLDLFFPITRNDFETICSDLILLCLKPVEDALESCGLSVDDINELILVGGMTRMPMIMSKLKLKFGLTPNNSLNPDEAIAAGAAIQGFMLSAKNNPFSESVTLLDITPLSLGVETIGGIMDILIPRNTVIPYSVSKMYTTDSDYEKSVLIKIYEGERLMTSDNIFVGEFELSNIPPEPRGVPEIEVSFNVDINGIITVTAEESDTHEKSSIIVNTNKGGLTKEQIENLVIEASELEARDEVERVTRLKFYQIDDICSNIKINIGNKNFKLSKSDQEIIEIDIQKTIIWLKEKKYFDRTMDELNETLETLKKKYGVLIVRGRLDDDDNTINASKCKTDANTTNIYDDEIDDDDKEKVIEMKELEDLGLYGLTDPEISELKELKKSLNDLCYSIFDIIENPLFIIEKEHKKELRDFIDDALLWICSHDKPTKVDYKAKIDEINDACDKILKFYEEKNTNIFEDEYSEIKTKLDELENLCLTIKVLIDSGTIPIKTLLLSELETKINNNLENIYNENFKDLSDDDLQKMIDEINLLSNNLFNKLQGLNISTPNITLNTNKEENEGTSIQDILKQRQEIEINTILADDNEEKNNINIDEALEELNSC